MFEFIERGLIDGCAAVNEFTFLNRYLELC